MLSGFRAKVERDYIGNTGETIAIIKSLFVSVEYESCNGSFQKQTFQ